MKQKKLPVILASLLIVIAFFSASCGVPGISNLFATETPTPTSTFTPTPTFTPSPTATSTPTNTPTATPLPAGVTTEKQDDGSTLFIDYDNNYQLIIPGEWLVIPLSSEDIADILENISDASPDLKDLAKTFSQLDPDVIRIVAINQNTKYISQGFSTNLTVTALEDKLMSSMPIDFVTGAVEESLKQRGATLISEFEPAAKNAHGVEIGVFEFQQESPTVTGGTVKIQAKTMIFKSNGKLIVLQLGTPIRFVDEIMPVLDQIKDTIEPVNP